MAITIGDAILYLRSNNDALDNGLKKAKSETQSTMKLLGGAAAIAGAAVGAVFKIVADGEKQILSQAKAQRDLARTIGSTAEQAGMLIEAADDMMISQETLTRSMETAIRKGYSPTISGLGEIAEKYNAIQDPIARSKFLMDAFGKSGAEMAPLMAKGKKAIEEMGQSALLNGQVISDAQARTAREVEMADDALGDAWDTLRKRMATPFLPIKIFIEEHITKIIEDANQLDYGIQQLGITQARVGPNMVFWQDQFGKIVAHSRLELEAYIAQQMLRVQWDESALSAVERLRAGLALKPSDWTQNTTTIHTTIEKGAGGGYGSKYLPIGSGGKAGGYAGYVLDKPPKGPPKAEGGDVEAGTAYPVGERGPEVFVPDQDGTIIPNKGAGAAVVNNYYYNLTAQYGFQSERSLRDDVRVLELLHG